MAEAKVTESVYQQSVGIIGAGPAGLITGYTLSHDGFKNVQLLTRDKTAGGVWSAERMYPGVSINSMHGFRFSAMKMPPPKQRGQMRNFVCGEDMTAYMRQFADTYLGGKIRFQTEVLDVRRGKDGSGWEVEVLNLKTGNKEVLSYDRIVVCTGGCSKPNVPDNLSAKSAEQVGFRGPIVHSSEFASRADQLLSEAQATPGYSVVVVGGGKSAQDISAVFARHGVKVSIVFEKADGVLATRSSFPDWVSKSRCLSAFCPHPELRTGLERFLHTTTLGSMITNGVWSYLTQNAFYALRLPKDSPLRNTYSIFWGIRINDEGTGKKDGFHALANEGKIDLIAPAKAKGFASDGKSILLQDGRTLRADAVILATGFLSSWKGILKEETIEEIGMAKHLPSQEVDEWKHYKTLSSPPGLLSQKEELVTSLYRGIIPAKNLAKRDFAVNGCVVTANNGYTWEVIAHWISSYFLGDEMRLPSTVEQALVETERDAAWMKKRFPDMMLWSNESFSSGIAFWSWPQVIDQLMDDMGLPNMRSGGNWLTWPFKLISVDEIATLREERQAKRKARKTLA